MSGVHEVDVQQIMERIRENIKSQKRTEETARPEDHVSPFDEGGASADLAYLHAGYDLEHVSFASHRQVLGALAIAIKNLLRRLLTPILQQQTAYNAANARVTTHIKEWTGALARQRTQAAQLLAERMETLERAQAHYYHLVVDGEAQRHRALAALESEFRQHVVAIQSRFSVLRDDLHAAQAQFRQDLLGTQAQGAAAEGRLRDDLHAAQAQFRQDLLGTQAQGAAAEGRLRDDLHAAQAQLRQDLLDTQAQGMAAAEGRLRDDLHAAQARLRQDLLDTQAQGMAAAEGRLRDDLHAAQARLRQDLLDTQAQGMAAAEGRLRDDLHAAQAQLRQDLLDTQAQGMAAAEGRLRDDLHAAQARLDEVLANRGQHFLSAQDRQREQLLATESRLSAELAAHAKTRQHVEQSSAAIRERVSGAERKLRRILHALGDGYSSDAEPRLRAEQPALPPGELDAEFDYAGFEDRFRGTEEDLKERQRIYLPYFDGAQQVIDIGCGRGEFLELLRERRIRSRGVDLDLDMVLLCREKGLDVVRDDAFAYLDSLADDSIGGIFAAQVIEHLPPPRAIKLIRLCHRKLGPGGALVVETLNPKCLMIFADSFYKDPSHVQPAHPDALRFVFEAIGFHQVELQFLSPVDPYMRIPPLHLPGDTVDQFNHGIERLNSLLFGFQDYAVIGRKGLATP